MHYCYDYAGGDRSSLFKSSRLEVPLMIDFCSKDSYFVKLEVMNNVMRLLLLFPDKHVTFRNLFDQSALALMASFLLLDGGSFNYGLTVLEVA